MFCSGKVAHGCYISKEAEAKGITASDLGALAAQSVGGRSGGKGQTVQGAGVKPEGIDEALEKLSALLKEKLTV